MRPNENEFIKEIQILSAKRGPEDIKKIKDFAVDNKVDTYVRERAFSELLDIDESVS